MTAPLPDGYIAHFPNAPAPRHAFDGSFVSVPAHRTLTRLPQTERTCATCGAVKVTVHEDGGGARREWRASATGEQTTMEPVCTGMIGVKE